MKLFEKATIEQAYLKAGFFGFAGSGKTLTSCLTMIGTLKYCEKLKEQGLELPYLGKPVAFVDTEGGSDFMVPVFEHFEIPLVVVKTRAFVDMIPAILEAKNECSGIIIDSVTHPWREFQSAYKEKKRRSFIAFEDWNYLKDEWAKFTSAFVNAPIHAILCGRAGYEYENSIDEETGKREIEKVGTRMKTEGEMAFEPSLLVEMELEQSKQGREIWNTAFIRKDRWNKIMGKCYQFMPNEDIDGAMRRTFGAFWPHIQLINFGGVHRAVDLERSSESTIPESAKSEGKKAAEDKEIYLEKIGNLFVQHGISSQSKEGKQKIQELLSKHAGTDSWKEMEFKFSASKMKETYRLLHIELNGADPFIVVAE